MEDNPYQSPCDPHEPFPSPWQRIKLFLTGRRSGYCSFCRKSYRLVGPLVEGPGHVYICHACILLCKNLIEVELRKKGKLP